MKKTIIIMAVLLGCVSVCSAEEKQQQPTPEQIQKQVEGTFTMMIPFVGKMMETMIEAQLTVLAKPESADRMAVYIKNFRDALIKQGFSKEEAFKIATSLPLPSAALSTK